MVYFEKSQPAPQSLEKEKQKKSGSYRQSDVIKQLEQDFCKKCYICEHKSNSLNVEHFEPHRGKIDLKFDWNNLFLVCSHCNNTKGDKYTNILNCTINKNVDINIAYNFSPFPRERPKFEALSPDVQTKNTVELLKKVFGISKDNTPLKNLDCINLNDQLLKEILEFQKLLLDYDECEDKECFLKKIQTHLNKTSQFTAFKRQIIRNNPYLQNEFEQYIKD